MGFFNKIISTIFGKATPAAVETTAPVATPLPDPAPTVGVPAMPAPTPGLSTAAAADTATAAPSAPAAVVDVEAVMSELAAKNPEKLDWKKSIVDLLKLLDIDSSLSARKELAAELHFSGDTSDSAAMNIWLHKAVLKKIAENGGKVPADLLD